jgi:hypothetical protein
MKKMRLALLGLLSALPATYTLIFALCTIIAISIAGPSQSSERFGLLFAIHSSVALLAFGLVCYYALDVCDNPDVPKDNRSLWLIVIILLGVFTAPAYWYIYKWRPHRDKQSESV